MEEVGMKIIFEAFHGAQHPKTGEPLDTTVAWYAVPGGGVATKAAIAAHCALYGIWAQFSGI